MASSGTPNQVDDDLLLVAITKSTSLSPRAQEHQDQISILDFYLSKNGTPRVMFVPVEIGEYLYTFMRLKSFIIRRRDGHNKLEPFGDERPVR
jgi:hypothetical protein